MKRLIPFLIAILIISCEKEDTKILFAEDLLNIVLVDPNEHKPSSLDQVQDTVYYIFENDHKMIKIRYDYIETEGQVTLNKRDTIECEYFIKENSLFMHEKLDPNFLSPIFGKDYAEWEVLKFTPDTMIVDAYSLSADRLHYGRWGFQVKAKE